MWPFIESWKDIVEEKQSIRAEALKSASKLGPSHAAYLKASGEEDSNRCTCFITNMRSPGNRTPHQTWRMERGRCLRGVHCTSGCGTGGNKLSDGRWVNVRDIRPVPGRNTNRMLPSVLFQQARREAQELDRHFRETKELKGPLHGVPVSFKDVCKCLKQPKIYTDADHIRGCRRHRRIRFHHGPYRSSKTPSVCGCRCTSIKLSMNSAILTRFVLQLVKTIREAGGIPIAKTNISQCMMFFECVNPVWGT